MNEPLNVKAGDLVVRRYRNSRRLERVEKVTPTGRIKVCGSYYNQYGNVIGNGSSYLVPATPEEIEKVRRQEIISSAEYKMSNFRKRLTYEDAVIILNILNKYQ